MRYEKLEDLPQTIRTVLPKGAQEIYLEAYEKVWDEYDPDLEPGDMDQEAVAHRNAWSAMKQECVHDEEKGIWYRKGEAPEEMVETDLLDKVKDVFTGSSDEG